VLTVFIATRDRVETLRAVLESYAGLREPSGGWKLVVIDNGGGADSSPLGPSFDGRLPLRWLCEPRPGKNRALNAGLGELEGDLAVFTDDDCVPEPDWLVELRGAADDHPDYAMFGGSIVPLWTVEPPVWVVRWVRLAPVFALTDPGWEEGPCDPARLWGPNMAIRAEPLRNGFRFDERLGPDGSATYAMGGETELTLRLAFDAELACWHCPPARVRHIVTPAQMTKKWILRRGFRLGRCVYRESRQRAAAGRPYVPRGAGAIATSLARETGRLVAARAAADRGRAFEARWQLNVWAGCLFEAFRARHLPRSPGAR
jgi:cellulose synthase/poly-beta-1,6-N-acetylglucosamine synthase-like glycosyltransferase